MYAAANGVGVILLFLGVIIYVFQLLCKTCLCRQCCKKKGEASIVVDGTWAEFFRSIFCNVHNVPYILLTVTIMFVFILIVISLQLGSAALKYNTSQVTDSGNGMMDIMIDSQPGVHELIISTSSDVLAPSLETMRQVITTSINLTLIVLYLETMNRTLHNLPLISDVKHNIFKLDSSGNNMESNTTVVKSDMTPVNTDTNAAKSSSSTVRSDMNTIGTYSLQTSSAANNVSTSMASVDPLVVYMNGGTSTAIATSITYDHFKMKHDDILGLHAIPSQLQFDYLTTGRVVTSTTSSEGMIDVITKDLTSSLRQRNGGKFPNEVTFERVTYTNGTFGTMQRLLDKSMDGSSNEIKLLTSKLQEIYNDLVNVPNMQQTANQLIDFNNTVYAYIQEVKMLQTNIATLSTVVNNEPDMSLIQSNTEAYEDSIKNYHLDSVLTSTTTVSDISTVMSAECDIIDIQIEAISLLSDTLTSLLGFINQINIINSTLVTNLPDGVFNITNLFDEINSTITKSLIVVDQYGLQLFELESQLADVDDLIDIWHSDSVSIENGVSVEYSSTDFPYYYSWMNLLADRIGQLQNECESTESLAADFYNSLQSLDISASYISHLTSLETTKTLLLQNLNQVINVTNGDYVQLAKGYCNSDTSKSCSANSDCISSGGTTCLSIGKYRCKLQSDQVCTLDSECSQLNDYCLADYTRANELYSLLDSCGKQDAIVRKLPDMSSTKTIVDSDSNSNHRILASSPVTNDAETVALNTRLETTKNSSAASMSASASTVDNAAQVSDTKNATALNSTSNNVNDLVSNSQFDNFTPLDALNYIMDSMIVSDITSALDDLGTTIDNEITKKLDLINKWLGAFIVIRDFLESRDGLQLFISRLKRNYLEKKLSIHGPGEMTTSIIEVFDNITNYFDGKQNAFDTPHLNLAKKLRKHFGALDRLYASDAAGKGYLKEHGSYYYILEQSRLTSNEILSVGHPEISGIITNSYGERYYDDSYCVLDTCVEHTNHVLYTAPMSEWDSEFPGSNIPLDISLSNFLLVLWTPIWIIVLLGVCTIACPLCPNKRLRDLRQWPACCLSCNIACQLPWILLITGFIFPFLIMFGDICSSGANIGSEYMIAYGDDFCSNTLNGHGTLHDCVFDKNLTNNLGGGNITFNVDIVGLYRGLLANDCSYSQDDPFTSLFDSLGNGVHNVPRGVVDSVFPESADHSSIPFVKVRLLNLLLKIPQNASSATGDIIRTFLRDEGRQAFDCEHMSSAVNDMTDVVCVSLYEPFFWYVGTWYLCAWVLLCCGLPLACVINCDDKFKVELITRTKNDGDMKDIPIDAIVGEGNVEMGVMGVLSSNDEHYDDDEHDDHSDHGDDVRYGEDIYGNKILYVDRKSVV